MVVSVTDYVLGLTTISQINMPHDNITDKYAKFVEELEIYGHTVMDTIPSIARGVKKRKT